MDERDEAENSLLLPRRRFRPVIIVGVCILLALIIGSSIFTFKQLTGVGELLGPHPVPTLAAGSNLFYFEEMPSWGTIAVDGHLLTPLPLPGTDIPPLKLAPGVHQVVWKADPFPTVHCAIFLPFRYSEQNCFSVYPAIQTFHGPSSRTIQASLLSFSAAINDLPQTQLEAIVQSTQNALAPFQGTTHLQRGEHFALTPVQSGPVLPPTIRTASSPLVATLNQYISISAATTTGAGLCVSAGLIDQGQSCMNDGQSCFSLCPLTETGISTPVNQWEVFAALNIAWTYTYTSGQTLTSYQEDPAEGAMFLVALSISRQGSQWKVVLAHSKSIDASPLANPACDAAQYELGQDSRFLSVAGSTQNITLKFVSGTNVAEGCVMEAFASTAGETAVSAHPLARCLYRFGVPLALDSEAHRSWPFLLQASSYEQQVAQQILAQAHST